MPQAVLPSQGKRRVDSTEAEVQWMGLRYAPHKPTAGMAVNG